MKKFDVAIAGGGVIGGAIALELARAGLRVGVFDRQQPGQEASWASAGILSPAPENPGMIPMVPLGKRSLSLYPDFVAQVEEISGKNTGFRPKGTLEAPFSHDTKAELSTIIALHHGLGLKAEPLRAEDARELEPALSEEVEAAVLRPEEASVDNRALTAAILEAAQRSGAEILSGNGAKGIWREGNRCAGLVLQNEKVEAKWTVIAAGCLSAAIELAPGLASARIEETWAGLRPDSPDHLPILGPTDLDGLLMATGHFRSGILLTPITARLVREWITEQRVSVDWDRFSPLRFQSAAEGSAHRAPA